MSEPTTSSSHAHPILPKLRSRPLDGRAPPAATDSDAHSLAEVRPGQVVEITEIFFQIVRNRCWELGIFEGEVFECVAVDGEEIVLIHPRRGTVEVSVDCARFVLTTPARIGGRRRRSPGSRRRA